MNKTSISATLIFTGNNELQQINLSAETDGDAAALARALDGILKRPGDEMKELEIRAKWLLAMIQVATLEAKLARLSG
jgi:hypothetical protein